MNTFEYGLQNIKLPIVSVRIENKILCFILYTGSTCSLIDSNVVEYFKDNLPEEEIKKYTLHNLSSDVIIETF